MTIKRDNESGKVEASYTAEEVQQAAAEQEESAPLGPKEALEHLSSLLRDGKDEDPDPEAPAKAVKEGRLFTIPANPAATHATLNINDLSVRILSSNDHAIALVRADYDIRGKVVTPESFRAYIIEATKTPTTPADLAATLATDMQSATGANIGTRVQFSSWGVTDEAWGAAYSEDDLDLTMGV